MTNAATALCLVWCLLLATVSTFDLVTLDVRAVNTQPAGPFASTALLHRQNPCTDLYRYRCLCSPNPSRVPIHVVPLESRQVAATPGTFAVRAWEWNCKINSLSCRHLAVHKGLLYGADEDSVYKWPGLVLICSTGCCRNV